MKTFNYPAFSAATNTTSASAAITARFITSVTAVATFSDNTTTGTIKFQASNDDAKNGTPTTWVDVPGSAATASVTSGATTTLGPVDVAFQWLRVSWTRTGGAGTLTVRVKGSERE